MFLGRHDILLQNLERVFCSRDTQILKAHGQWWQGHKKCRRNIDTKFQIMYTFRNKSWFIFSFFHIILLKYIHL